MNRFKVMWKLVRTFHKTKTGVFGDWVHWEPHRTNLSKQISFYKNKKR